MSQEASRRIASIAVFCGASRGNRPEYLRAAERTGRALAERGIDVVFGASHLGLMGAVADGALAAGGRVIGVIPRHLLEREKVHENLTELVVVDSMHQRKQQMALRSDAFLALPGGPGTLEEITEQWTWAQLGIHNKPCGVLDVLGHYRPFRELVASMSANGFTHHRYTALIAFGDDLDALIHGFEHHTPPTHSDASPGQELDSSFSEL